jgi:AcrR family transcriptional regulator
MPPPVIAPLDIPHKDRYINKTVRSVFEDAVGTKGEQTREMIIRQSAAVFNRFGYFGTSMSDIMRETGLEKGGIYNHFENKEDLALAAFEYAVGRTSTKIEEAFRSTRNAADRLLAFMEVFRSLINDPILPGGCPVLNTAIEADDANPVLKERARAAMNELCDTVNRVVAKGIERDEVNPQVDAQSAATILISTLEGAMMMSKLYDDPRYMDRAIDHLRAYVESSLRA